MKETTEEVDMEESLVMPELAVSDLRAAWRSAVRSYNTCENSGLRDSCTAIAEIVVKLSQQLDYAETMCGGAYEPV